jgi:hypothetical protein
MKKSKTTVFFIILCTIILLVACSKDDTNSNNEYDITKDDTNGNGEYDIIKDDTNGIGGYDIIKDDTNGNSEYDIIKDDTNGNSEYDITKDDTNGDSEYDIIDSFHFIIREFTIREKAKPGANSVSHTSNGFVMTLNIDKEIYSTTDIVSIWATLEYVGDSDFPSDLDSVTILLNERFLLIHLLGIDPLDRRHPFDFAMLRTIEKGEVYHIDYKAPGYRGTLDLVLPAGEHWVSLRGGFDIVDEAGEFLSGNGLGRLELTFEVVEQNRPLVFTWYNE